MNAATKPLQTVFNTIGIFTKQHDERIEATLNSLIDHLEHYDTRIMVDKSGAKTCNNRGFCHDEMMQEIDLAIIIGGDGTLLHTGRLLSNFNIPILGINLGRLGFLVDVSPTDMTNIIDQVIAGKFIKEVRTLLKARVYRGDELLGEEDALNDVVFHVRNEVRMIEFTTHINGTYVNKQRADGIVVATPTGSTAYSLSSGGPILHPGLDAVTIVPICPHTLSHRPIAIQASDTIEIKLCEGRNSDARVSFDGQSHIDIVPGDRAVIQKKQRSMTLLHPENYDYYHILRAKLHWSVQP
jgi:NAD+ kinase